VPDCTRSWGATVQETDVQNATEMQDRNVEGTRRDALLHLTAATDHLRETVAGMVDSSKASVDAHHLAGVTEP